MGPIMLEELAAKQRKGVADGVRRNLFKSCRKALEEAGNDLAGYALVTWTRDGDLHSAYDARNGPIRDALVPTLAGDALNRHVAIVVGTWRHHEQNA